jgi:predicted transcriptional regulator
MNSSYEALRTLTSSRLRQDILSSLERPMRLCELRRAIRSNAPNTSSKARELQDLGLITRNRGDYMITPVGSVIQDRLSTLLKTIEAIYGNLEFWERMLDKVPGEIICSLHEFSDAKLVKSNRSDIDRVKKEILRKIRNAERELTVILPLRCDCIVREVEKVSKGIDTRLETFKENPDLRYGMVKTNGTTILFTEMLDMALIKES